METLIGARYKTESEIGEGGMGTVYKGTDTLTKATVAIKRLKSNLVGESIIERFKREGEALRELNHPNIVKMLDMFEDDGEHYLVMEYVAGGDLAKLSQQAQLSINRVLEIAIDLADALTRAHKLGIIHRDLKPANILIGDDGVLRLTDFGIAHVGSKERVTDTDAIIGTVDYLPPEAFKSAPYDARGDIWAFGVILFEMLTGKSPFSGSSVVEVVRNITLEPIPDIEDLVPDTPIALIDLIYRMLERDPQARISSVRHVGAALEDMLYGRDNTLQSQLFVADVIQEVDQKHNLPAQMTPFVGREAELGELTKLINDPHIRLITIVAPGGMGKSRLALEVAQRCLKKHLFSDGVYFVELAPIISAENIVATIASAIGYQFEVDKRTQEQQISDYLSNKNILLIMDNYEHLLDEAELVTTVLKAASNVTIIATSRQRLEQQGEALFHLSGMDFPKWETPEDALEYAAVKLFMNSAVRSEPSFELTEDNLDYVARICRLVGGMPLGIVLAASWLSMLSPEEIASEIANGIEFLDSDGGELPDRQRSIQVVFDYSWNMLTDTEQQIFMKLSVFRDGFTREAAQSLTGASLRQLMNLTNKSLIYRDAQTARYNIHELARQYAEFQLEKAGSYESARLAHMTYFAEYVYAQEEAIRGYKQFDVLKILNADVENIFDALTYAGEAQDGEAIEKIAGTFWDAIFMNASSQLLGRWRYALKSAIEQLSTENIDAKLFNRMQLRGISLEMNYNNAHEFLPKIEPIIATANSFDDIFTLCLGHVALSMVYGHQQPTNHGLVLETFDTALNYAAQLDKLHLVANVYLNWAIYYQRQGYFDDSIASSQKALELYKEQGNRFRTALVYMQLSKCYENLGDGDQFMFYMNEAVKIFDLTGTPMSINVQIELAEVNFFRGEIASSLDITQMLLDKRKGDGGIWVFALLSLNSSALDEDYEAALDLAEKAHETYERTGGLGGRATMYFGFAMAECGLGHDDLAQKNHLRALKMYPHAHRARSVSLVISAVQYARRGEYEKAIEYLSLAKTLPQLAAGWIDEWTLSRRLQSELRDKFDEQQHDEIWERGKQLDLDAVVQELLDEFGEDA